MVLVFDMDDTLFEEITYVKSGFKEVATYLFRKYSLPPDDSYEYMLKRIEGGRGHIFNDVLLKYNLFSNAEVRKCLSIYRSHRPHIHLYKDAEKCLNRFKHLPLYIVTDGNKIVQNNKLKALGLYDRVKFCYITHRYGIRQAKPSPYCFLKICEREKVEPHKVFYIGDNPNKDFIGIKPMGFKTIRVLRGMFKDIRNKEEYEADLNIYSLDELDNRLFMAL
ncbi:MAG: haloacid dehalogenase [Peptococcaceae bacterium BICA1-7]|nr:MAG: haloacid dehalogenase [Peptococcaceae bacterium BICA1-7]HBV96590.1 HAD family hydrolase [Desulfotomaculum sp.]